MGNLLGQPVLASPADRARRKARRSTCSMGEFIGVSDEVVAALESDDDNIGVDGEIDTLSSGLRIDKSSTSRAESPSVTDLIRW